MSKFWESDEEYEANRVRWHAKHDTTHCGPPVLTETELDVEMAKLPRAPEWLAGSTAVVVRLR